MIEARSRLRSSVTALILAAFSVIYFADVWLRASEKYFWYDELFTIYICRLPSWAKIWDTLRHGIDYNPPLLYILTRASHAIFGEGLISTRLPEIIGFWIFCLCLFRFVSRRVGRMGGFIAMLFPLLTGAFYYASEARPYGLLLGFCGLALVCWQMTLEELGREWWVFAFGMCIFALLMTHCYAVLIVGVFGLAEVFRTVQSRRIQWQMWIAMGLPSLIAVAMYGYLFLAFRSVSRGTNFVDLRPLTSDRIPSFYLFLFGPCVSIVLIVLAVLAVKCTAGWEPASVFWRILTRSTQIELVWAVLMAALPVFGLFFVKAIRVPFFDRYFIAALAGFCILIGIGAGAGRRASWAAVVLLCMALNAGWQVSKLAWHRYQGWPDIVEEPSSGFSMNVSLEGPLERYSLLTSRSRNNSLPIGLLEPLDVFYLINYAPNLAPRLYYIRGADNDFFYHAANMLRPWFPGHFSPAITRDEFVRLAPHVLIYGANDVNQLSAFLKIGATVKTASVSNGRFLAELESRGEGH